MRAPTLNSILAAAARAVQAWPAWMQRPEYRLREPSGNRPNRPRKRTMANLAHGTAFECPHCGDAGNTITADHTVVDFRGRIWCNTCAEHHLGSYKPDHVTKPAKKLDYGKPPFCDADT